MLIDGQKQEIVLKVPLKVSPTGETFYVILLFLMLFRFCCFYNFNDFFFHFFWFTTAIVTTLAPSSILIKRTPNVARPV